MADLLKEFVFDWAKHDKILNWLKPELLQIVSLTNSTHMKMANLMMNVVKTGYLLLEVTPSCMFASQFKYNT